MPRQNYDLIDAADGKVLASVRYIWPEEPSDCCMCGRPTLDHFAVPYYCGPVRSGKSEGGYAPACQRCYDRWARWDDAMEEYDSWLAVLRPRDLLAGVDDDAPRTAGVLACPRCGGSGNVRGFESTPAGRPIACADTCPACKGTGKAGVGGPDRG